MREPNDTSFEALLASTLAERAAQVPATVTFERVHARLEARQGARRRGAVRRPLTLLGVAAAVLLPTAALVVGQRPSEPLPADSAAHQGLVRRRDGDSWLVVAVRGDGRERTLATVPIPDPGDERRRPQMAVSDDGWLATPGATGWEFRDLRSTGPDHRRDRSVPAVRGRSRVDRRRTVRHLERDRRDPVPGSGGRDDDAREHGGGTDLRERG